MMMFTNLCISAQLRICLQSKACFMQPRRVRSIRCLSSLHSRRSVNLQDLSESHPCKVQSRRAICMSRLCPNKTFQSLHPCFLDSRGALSAGFVWNKNTQSLSSSLPSTMQSRRSVSSDAGYWGSMSETSGVLLTEQLLVGVQESSGLPWWSSIICTTLALRFSITLPLSIYQAHIIAKIEALQKEIAELAMRLRVEVTLRAREKSWNEKTCKFQYKRNMKRIVSELYVRDNCHPFKMSVLAWVQIPMWICVSFALRNLSSGNNHTALEESALSAGGALWIPDLTLPDSTWVIPITLGLINLLITEIFALKLLKPSRIKKYATNLIRGFSIIMIPIAAYVPSCMSLYWLSSSCVGLFQVLLLKSPRFRSLCRIPVSPSDSQSPYRDIVRGLKDKYIR